MWYICVVKKTEKTQLNVLQIGSINHVGFVYIIYAYSKSSALNITKRRRHRSRFLVGRHHDLLQKCTPLTDRMHMYTIYSRFMSSDNLHISIKDPSVWMAAWTKGEIQSLRRHPGMRKVHQQYWLSVIRWLYVYGGDIIIFFFIGNTNLYIPVYLQRLRVFPPKEFCTLLYYGCCIRLKKTLKRSILSVENTYADNNIIMYPPMRL